VGIKPSGRWRRVGGAAVDGRRRRRRLGAVAIPLSICATLSLSLYLWSRREELREARAWRASHRDDALFLSPPPCSDHDIPSVEASGTHGTVEGLFPRW
jgi:hypothetical protein